MVTVFLRGGLGNQMFQYALGLNLSIKNHERLVLDTTHLHDRFPRREITFRNYDLDIFGIQPEFTSLSKISSAFPVPGVWLGLDLFGMQLSHMLGFQKIVREKNELRFDPAILDAGKNAILYGRWQSEKYFSEHADAVRKAFQFTRPLEGEALRLGNMMKECNAVAIHVRRGDYVNFSSMKKIMGDTNLEYYRNAANYVASRVKDPRFFVFSNDIAWCRENLKLDFETVYCDTDSAGPKDIFHLELMALAKHNIITNSTFSWWGAWLNQNPGKIVTAPKLWRAGSGEEDADMVPENWVRL